MTKNTTEIIRQVYQPRHFSFFFGQIFRIKTFLASFYETHGDTDVHMAILTIVCQVAIARLVVAIFLLVFDIILQRFL